MKKGLDRAFISPWKNAKKAEAQHIAIYGAPDRKPIGKNITGNYFGDAVYRLFGGETFSRALNGDVRSQGQLIMGGLVSLAPGSRMKPGSGVLKKTSQVSLNRIAGNEARNNIAARFPGSRMEVTKQTTDGVRFIDVLTNGGLAIESKVGRTSLTKSIGRQVAKDVELMSQPGSGVLKVEWQFTKSGVTGKGGPTKPLKKALDAAGIGIKK